MTIGPLGIVLLVGMLSYRYEPEESLLAHQQWRYRHFVIVWCVFTASQFVGVPPSVMRWPEWAWTVSYAFTGAVIIVSVWGAVRWNQPSVWRAVGFDRSTALLNIVWALRIALGVASVGVVFGLLAKPRTPIAIDEALGVRNHPAAFAARCGVQAVLIPFAEELLFRGFAYQPLLRKLGPLGATIGSALLWGAVHYIGPSHTRIARLVAVCVVGVIYAEVYRRRQSLFPTVTFHVVFNAVGVLISFTDASTLVPTTAVLVGLWVISLVLFRLSNRARAVEVPK